ncbi:MAG TPA: MmcQ/YjbR family DNA-binding protein [Jatrophihabitans sp.]
MVTIEDVRSIALSLPRSYEAVVRDRVKFRVGRIVYLALSRDETILGFGFPREAREAMVAAEPELFLMPGQSELRYNWLHVRMAPLDSSHLEELVIDAWLMVVPRRVAEAYLTSSDQRA